MATDKIRKYVLPNIPYLFIGWFCLKIGTAYRLAAGAGFGEKLLGLGQTIGAAFASFAPGLAPLDWFVGIVGAVGFRLLIYCKAKKAKKFRHDAEYGTARWGTEKDIKPFVDPRFENNVILTGTEFLTMNTRPKIPANARNLNCCIIGSSGSGKTRFWLTPQLLQAHSSYVVVDPKGGVLGQVGSFLQKRGYKIKVFNSINFSKSIDKEHIHNHIYYNSTAYDRSRKFRNFIGSSFALRRLSDRVCLEHDLSVIVNPKLHSKGRYLHYGQWLGENQKLSQKEQIRFAIDTALTERPVDFADFLRRMETAGIQVKHGRGGVISFLVPGQQRAARFRASTLGDGYGPEDVQAVIDGKAPTRTATARKAPAPRRVNLLIDIQERMRQGKGPAYERWAKVYNLKQMAAALQYLKEHQLFEYDDLAAKTDAATERFHTLAGDIQQTEAELSRVSDLMAAVVQYAKTRPAFDGYKAAKYSRKYLAEHEAELADYRAAKATMAELLGGEKLPKMDVLKEKRRQLAARKKALYLEYRKAQQDMRELVAVKGSVDHLRGLTDNQRNKEQAR